MKELCKNNLKILFFKLNYVEFPINAQKNYFCFYENSSNDTFTFINCKVAYFKKHLAY